MLVPGVNPPPVDIILIQSAPSLNWLRIAWTTSEAVSASVPNMLQCPPVVVIGVPVTRRRGPGMIPSSIACRTGKATWFLLPRSRIVVTPEVSAALTAWTALISSTSSLSVVTWRYASDSAEQWMWECISMKPGRIVPPGVSTTSVSPPGSGGRVSREPTETILPFSTTSAASATGSAPVPSISRAAFRTVLIARCSRPD